MLELLVLAMLLGLIPAYIAQKKGESFVVWWLYGALLLIVALPHAILKRHNPAGLEEQRRASGQKKCQHCAEWVQADAKVCRYCGRDLRPPRATGEYRPGIDQRPLPPILRNI